ncbi:SDR family NAD(P)-dependent oxidoreductase [Rubrivirga sp.]|uniref:SDR family NAD(P)-dependent oxidoreductase n=1 Tax=Rubrivirga sp. TaxID=1885344 RepID=UPI003B517976
MSSNAPDLTGHVVVVTGADGRLGRVVAHHLAEAGARVAGLDRTAHGTGDLSVQADVTDPATVDDALARVADVLGEPDGLVHAVGMWAGEPFVETSLADWQTVLDVNLTSTFVVFQAAVRRLVAAGRAGRLVALASGQGADRGAAEQAAYSASKAGVVRLVEAVAAEYRTDEISAAAVAPSMILFGEEDPDARGVEADEIARLCVTLCGPAGDVHSGSVLRAYGSMR